MSALSYLEILEYLKSSQVAYRHQDGILQVLDFSQLPWAFRSFFNAQGFFLGDIPASGLIGEISLDNHSLVGVADSESLTIDGGLL